MKRAGLIAMLFAGCVATPESDTSETTQEEAGDSCELHRPLGWSGWAPGWGNVSCMEDRWISPEYVWVPHGQVYTANGIPWGLIGYGTRKIKCLNGAFVLVSSTCKPIDGNPQ